MSLHLDFEDSTDGDLIEVDVEYGVETITLTVNCGELTEDTDYDGVYVEMTPEEARRLVFHLLLAVGYAEVEL